ncbi:VOC family protein [Cumulibacter soli]|uniref:VOC family protein n=1 Tax=Cumulibacter soli TaxID=2546344 RepID=UPI00106863FE|nr:VOC family protein [Cumulibacter soli]
MTIIGLDHVQVAIPSSGEEDARVFYGVLLGMDEIQKPPVLATRGGCWFQSGSAVLHLDVEEPFAPARKAHPAFLVDELDALAAQLVAAGYECIRADDQIPGVRRFHTFDPCGNRIEFQQV